MGFTMKANHDHKGSHCTGHIDGLVQKRRNYILVILQERQKMFTKVIIIVICKDLQVLYEIHYCHSYGMLKLTILTH